MKKLITIVLLIFISNLSFGQIPLKKEGDFYELNDLWKRDSISVKQLIDKFNLDITKLETVQLFEQFDFAKKLQDEIKAIEVAADSVSLENMYKLNGF